MWILETLKKIYFLVLDPYSAPTCEAGGRMTCHSSATCENLSQGFCCKCIQGRKLGKLWSLLDNAPNYLVGCAI